MLNPFKLLRRLRFLLSIGVVAFLLTQLVPYRVTNPPTRSEPKWDSARTRQLAVAACFDCHSNETKWPWYSNIAPMSWLVQRDVDEGRQHLNFSTWSAGQGGGDAADMLSSGKMPPFQYTIMHPEANLSDADKAAFIEGLTATFGGGGD